MINLEGKSIATALLANLKQKITECKRPPGLAVFLVGEDAASQVYVRMKQKRCEDVGIHVFRQNLPATTSQGELIAKIQKCNQDPAIDGILVQLPLPKSMDTEAILSSIAPEKDVDGLHPQNLGLLAIDQATGFTPCTPAGILELIDHYQIPTKGKNIAILGRSRIVGRPLSLLLSNKKYNATVTLLHSQSIDWERYVAQADVVIAAVGQPQILKKHHFKKDAWAIDVGINRLPDTSAKGYQLIGDIDPSDIDGHLAGLSPVPGGVGPLTIAMLLTNTYKAYHEATA